MPGHSRLDVYYRGALKRDGEVVWLCESNIWAGHDNYKGAQACAQKVIDLIKQGRM